MDERPAALMGRTTEDRMVLCLVVQTEHSKESKKGNKLGKKLAERSVELSVISSVHSMDRCSDRQRVDWMVAESVVHWVVSSAAPKVCLSVILLAEQTAPSLDRWTADGSVDSKGFHWGEQSVDRSAGKLARWKVRSSVLLKADTMAAKKVAG